MTINWSSFDIPPPIDIEILVFDKNYGALSGRIIERFGEKYFKTSCMEFEINYSDLTAWSFFNKPENSINIGIPHTSSWGDIL